MTVFGHAIAGVLGTRIAFARAIPRPGWPVMAAAAVIPTLPDIDVLTFLWLPYGHTFGHRGFTHSIFCGLIVGTICAGVLQLLARLERSRRSFLKMLGFVTLLWTSHGVVDAMTTGGRGVLLFYPVYNERVWAPVRFIPVSPIPSMPVLSGERRRPSTTDLQQYRDRLLAEDGLPAAIPRAVVRRVTNPRWARAAYIFGVVLTELLILSPMMILAFLRREKSI